MPNVVHRVGSGPSTTKIEECPQSQKRVGTDTPDTDLCASLSQLLPKVRTLECASICPVPDMGVTIGIEFEIALSFSFKNLREPRIIAPVGLYDDRVRRSLLPEEFIHRI
jgi:hypothetical protein